MLVSFCFCSERNSQYVEICRNRMGNDKYVDRSIQTLNGAAKMKQVQCDSRIMVDTGLLTCFRVNVALIDFAYLLSRLLLCSPKTYICCGLIVCYCVS